MMKWRKKTIGAFGSSREATRTVAAIDANSTAEATMYRRPAHVDRVARAWPRGIIRARAVATAREPSRQASLSGKLGGPRPPQPPVGGCSRGPPPPCIDLVD